jgi:sugar-specific transcriptional regulator TrmB
MTQEWMLRTLINLRVKQQDAQMYVFLALHGSTEARDIACALKVHRRQVYRTLDRLGHRNFIIRTPNIPAQFIAVSFEKVLNLLMSQSLEGAKDLERKKAEILSFWKSNLKEFRIAV